ncbi:MAG: hypothetical protein H0T53_10285 [Herpetosiphonaceae bacterium]|nr:hypothetical protein [Herpetosiphonaceae bacterium]
MSLSIYPKGYMKFKPLILIAGTLGIIILVALVGRTIQASGGDAERAIPRLLGYLFFFTLLAVIIKRIFLRQR